MWIRVKLLTISCISSNVKRGEKQLLPGRQRETKWMHLSIAIHEHGHAQIDSYRSIFTFLESRQNQTGSFVKVWGFASGVGDIVQIAMCVICDIFLGLRQKVALVFCTVAYRPFYTTILTQKLRARHSLSRPTSWKVRTAGRRVVREPCSVTWRTPWGVSILCSWKKYKKYS